MPNFQVYHGQNGKWTPRCLTACRPVIQAADISYMAKQRDICCCPLRLRLAAVQYRVRVGRIALHKLVQNSSRDALADRKFIKPLQPDCCWPNKRSQAAFSDCTSFKVPLLSNPCPNMLKRGKSALANIGDNSYA
ncbi:5'-nucleotidase SurE [Trichinella pseudospiralis]